MGRRLITPLSSNAQVYYKSSSPSPGSIPLPNLGRESHTYLHHIVLRYDDLAERTVFTRASTPVRLHLNFGARQISSSLIRATREGVPIRESPVSPPRVHTSSRFTFCFAVVICTVHVPDPPPRNASISACP